MADKKNNGGGKGKTIVIIIEAVIIVVLLFLYFGAMGRLRQIRTELEAGGGAPQSVIVVDTTTVPTADY